MTRCIMLLTFWLSAFAAWAEGPSGDLPAMTFEKLKDLIRTNHVTTIEELLPLLPVEYRNFYTLVYDSKSLQHRNVFPDQPRVILYGYDARFILAFAKDPQALPAVNIADTMEIIEFDDATASFKFRLLEFIKGQDPLREEPEVNPTLCLTCHRKDPRPNWHAYNVWPGVYGSVSRLRCDTMQAGTKELEYYQSYLTNYRHQGRYKFLPPEIANHDCPADVKDEFTFRNGKQTDANALLSERLFSLNAKRLRRIIAAAPSFPSYKYVISAIGKYCATPENIESYFPPEFAQRHGYTKIDVLVKSLEERARREFKNLLEDFFPFNTGSKTEPARQPINFLDPNDPLGGLFRHQYDVGLLLLLAERLGLDPKDWSTGFRNGFMQFSTPSANPFYVFMDWHIKDPVDGDLSAMSCEELKNKSLAAFPAVNL